VTVRAENIEETKYGGLCTWVREPAVVSRGGFAGRIITLRPKDVEVPYHPILEDFVKPFDPSEYARAPRRAPTIGVIQDQERFAQQGQQPRQVRQLPIKIPGTDVKLPCEFAQFEEAVQIIIDHNQAVNRDYPCSFAYLNVFRGLTLFSEESAALGRLPTTLEVVATSLWAQRPAPPAAVP
jgi:hypothetical protein